MRTKTNEVYKSTKNTFRKYVYSKQEYFGFTLILYDKVKWNCSLSDRLKSVTFYCGLFGHTDNPKCS